MLATRLAPLLLASLTAALAQQPAVRISSLSPTLGFGTGCIRPIDEIAVTLDTANLPPLTELRKPSLWSGVLVHTNNGVLAADPFAVQSVDPMIANGVDQFAMNGVLLLKLAQPLTKFPKRMMVHLDFLNGSIQVWTPSARVATAFGNVCDPAAEPPPPPSTPTPPLVSATKPPTAPGGKNGCQFGGLGFFAPTKPGAEQMRLSGAWTTGYSTRPFYNIDAQMEVPICAASTFDLSLGGTIKTAERRSIDPDSFTAFLLLKPKATQPLGRHYQTWSLRGGGEFSRIAQYENVVFAPQYVFGRASFRTDPAGRLRYSYGYEFTGAFETGVNRRTKAFRSGYGYIGRVAPAMTAYILFPMGGPKRSLLLQSTYNPRVLLSPEPFTDQRIWIAHQTPFRSFASGTRHYWANQVSAELTDFVGLTLKTEFGSIPPAFNIIDHRVTTGLVIKWRWREK